MKMKIKQYPVHKKSKIENRKSKIGGSVLVLTVVSLTILVLLGLAMLSVTYGVRHRAIQLKNEAAAMLAAEAGYEKAVFWMSQQMDMLSALQQDIAGTSGTISFTDSSCDYQIGLFTFVHSRPIYRVVCNGHSGVFNRTVDAYVVQAVSGWDMGMCRVPTGGTNTTAVNFADGEIIDVPVHINKYDDPGTDYRDIYITGSPQFKQRVAMGESKYRSGGGGKTGEGGDSRTYDALITAGLFEPEGILFDQPDSRITDEDAVQMKVDRFRTSTDDDYNFSDDTSKKPVASSSITNPLAAVQLEFFEVGGVGKVRITNNCTVRGFRQSQNSRTYDFEIIPGTDGEQSQRYYIYAYHYAADSEPMTTVAIKDTYVTQSFGGVESEPAGQIFIDGDVIIGSKDYNDMVVKGKITVVAAKDEDGNGGNIWIADRVGVSDYDDTGTYYPRDSNGMPAADNPNILGLIAQGVIKVVDPGMSGYAAGGTNGYPGPPAEISGFEYIPIGQQDSTTTTTAATTTTTTAGTTTTTTSWTTSTTTTAGTTTTTTAATTTTTADTRHLPDPMWIEAAMVIGGGGWGAENVRRSSYGGRKEWPGSAEDPEQDFLIVRGSIVECCRGVVGLIGQDGYLKRYYFDKRVLTGILPGDIWLQGKYIPAPAGWHDYRQ
jgi:hypothetical protein